MAGAIQITSPQAAVEVALLGHQELARMVETRSHPLLVGVAVVAQMGDLARLVGQEQQRLAAQAVQAQAGRVVDLLAQALQVAALGQTAAAVVVVHRRLVAKVGLEEHPASGRQLLGEPQARVVAAVAVVLAQALYRALEEFTAVALVELTAADPHPVDKV